MNIQTAKKSLKHAPYLTLSSTIIVVLIDSMYLSVQHTTAVIVTVCFLPTPSFDDLSVFSQK